VSFAAKNPVLAPGFRVPLRRIETLLVAAVTSPRLQLPLMGLRALQSIVCDIDAGTSGSLLPPWRPAFRPGLRGILGAAVPRSLIHGFILSCASLPSRVLRTSPAPGLPTVSTFPGVSLPFATSVRGVHLVRLAPAEPQASQARFVPPSTFFTSPTASSSTNLVGLFHPTATSGIRSSGAFPPAEPHGLPPAVALVSFASVSYPVARAPETSARLQGLALRVSPLRDAVV